MLISIEMLKDFLKDSGMKVTNVGTCSYGFHTVRFLQEDKHDVPHCIFIRGILPEEEMEENECCIDTESRPITLTSTDNNRLFDLVQDCIRYYTDWDDSIRNALLSNCSLNDLLDLSRGVFKNPILVDDSSFRTLSMSTDFDLSRFKDMESKHMQEHGFHSPEYISNMLESPIFRSINSKPHKAKIYLYDFLAHPNIITAISSGEQILGYFTVIGLENELTLGLVDLSEHFAKLLSILLVRETQTNAFKNKSLDNDLIREILHGRVSDRDLIQATFSRIGFAEDPVFTIAIFALDEDVESDYLILQRMSNHLEAQLPNSIWVQEVNKIILIIKENSSLTAMNRVLSVSHEFQLFSNVRLGYSLPCRDVLKVSIYYDQALTCLRFGSLASPDKMHCRYDEVVGYDLIDHYGDTERLMAICHPAIKLLADYDGQKGSVLLPTLRVLLRCHGDTSAAAEAMFVHRNSMYYRMKQISTIAGIDLRNDVTLHHLSISLRIYDLKEVSGGRIAKGTS